MQILAFNASTRDHIGEFASAGGLAVRKVYSDTNRWFPSPTTSSKEGAHDGE